MNLTIEESCLLSFFRESNCIQYIASKNHQWYSNLPNSVESTIAMFIDKGLLQKSELESILHLSLSQVAAKNLLIEHGLKKNGNKSTLIARIIAEIPSASVNFVDNSTLYRCVEDIHSTVDEFLNTRKHTENCYYDKISTLLLNGYFNDAIKISHELTVYKTLDPDATNFLGDNIVNKLDYIMRSTPKILSGIDSDVLTTLRLEASIYGLTGKINRLNKRIHSVITGIHLDAAAACRMLIFHSDFKLTIDNYKELEGEQYFLIDIVNDGVICNVCQNEANMTYSLKALPEIPLENCSCSLGCRASIIAL